MHSHFPILGLDVIVVQQQNDPGSLFSVNKLRRGLVNLRAMVPITIPFEENGNFIQQQKGQADLFSVNNLEEDW